MASAHLVTTEAAIPAKRETLVRLLQLYLHDLSAVEPLDVDESGSFGADDLDDCWTEDRRHPFVIRANGNAVGGVSEGTFDRSGRPATLYRLSTR